LNEEIMKNQSISAVRDRSLQPSDLPLLAESLSSDAFHKGTTPEFFSQYGTVCNVYEDDKGPICYVRGSKALRLELHFADNYDAERNTDALRNGVATLAQKARENGFLEIVFTTNNPALAAFAKDVFGFEESAGELRKVL